MEEEDTICFVYKNREEYIDRRNKLFEELKDNIYFSDNMFKLLVYSGIKGCYKILKINQIIKNHLNALTDLKQQEWVDDVCWHVFRSVETSIDMLPLYILKKFDNEDFEKYLLNIIKNVLIGGDTEGFLSFIEDKNIYVESNKELMENINNVEEVIENDLVLEEL